MSITEQRDWHARHTDYENADSDLSRRLKVVQAEIRKVLPVLQQIRAKVAAAGLDVEVVEGDAADTSLYHGATPADLVLAVGIFGNISDDDVFTTIRALPQFCKPGATVLWSRGRHLQPDITAQIRSTFVDAGFVETAFHAPEHARFQIGADRYEGSAQGLQPGHLFTFLK